LDRIVDSYFPILDGIEDELEAVEKLIVREPTKKTIANRLFRTKRELLSFRKATWPARDVFSMLSKGQLPNFSKKNQIYYRDIYDHVVLVIDLVETYRDLTSGIMETYLSTISNNMNEVMKVLTVIATIFIPLTFVTGLYGMNFRPEASSLNMPELNWEWGYPFSLALMLVMGLSMLWYFRKKDWI
jgi:magnesium transporter